MRIKSLFFIFVAMIILIPGAFAEGKGHGGDEFRKTAEEYEMKAEKWAKKGWEKKAAAYKRMAEIKRHAAELGDEGRWDDIDWSEYHKLNESLHGKEDAVSWDEHKSMMKHKKEKMHHEWEKKKHHEEEDDVTWEEFLEYKKKMKASKKE